ncbi:MAG: DUF1553 domain-containing protein [Gemmataceae bacterium]
MVRILACLTLVASASGASGQTGAPDAEAFFETKIRPVLIQTCGKCHGGDKVKGGLRLNARASLLKGGESGPAIVPGDPDKSLLIQALRQTHETLKMPPDKPLPRDVVADFVAWVKHDAVWPESKAILNPPRVDHWSFRPVKSAEPPVDPDKWSDHPIDRFLAAKLREQGLKPVGPADKRTLLRRATYDLIGLPPTPGEIAAFLADDSPDAFAKVVERLLASPAYGERWARHWMDVAHYADTAGDNADYPIPESRLYRDYLIDAFNADKPYDEFVREQLAGDILAKQGPKKQYAERVIATGFLALSRRYATAPYELWHLTLEDTIETTGAVFLGLTLRCARCHDHKFDPITMEDYYGLYAIFSNTTFPYAGSEELASKGFSRQHMVPLLPPELAEPRIKAFEEKIKQQQTEMSRVEKEDALAQQVAGLNKQLDDLKKRIESQAKDKQDVQPLQNQVKELTQLRDQAAKQLEEKVKKLRADLRNFQRPGLPSDVPGAYAVSEGKPTETRVQLKGDPDKPGPVAKRCVPKFLTGNSPVPFAEDSSGRMELAQWLTRPENPLTARVLVNRVWHYHFGTGIVATPSNFGVRGEPPSHPELLDWLTTQFIKDGWSIKALHRRIMLSKAYQLASTNDPANAAKDPANRWHWRFERHRLEAEAIRDALLAISGNLDRKRPGVHPFPPIAQWGWTQHNAFKEVYPSNHRSVYLMTQRLQRHPFLALFDGPDTNHSTDKRTSSTVPLQALYLMNNPFIKDQAETLAKKLIAATAEEPRRIERLIELAWGRPPVPTEVQKAVAYVNEYKKEVAKTGVSHDKRELEAWTSYARIVLTANEFFYVD